MFQPAEEGHGGAEAMLSAGVLLDPVNRILLYPYGFVEVEPPAGEVGITAGPLMPGSDTFSIRVEGSGGHGALPHKAIDPGILQLTRLSPTCRVWYPVHKSAEFRGPQRHLHSGWQRPQHYSFLSRNEGYHPHFEPDVRRLVLEHCARIVTVTASALGCMACFESRSITPPVVNDPAVTSLMIELIPENSTGNRDL